MNPSIKLIKILVEFYYYTNANAVIWLAEPLHTISHYSSPLNFPLSSLIKTDHVVRSRAGTICLISVQGLELLYEIAMFSRFSKVLGRNFDENEKLASCMSWENLTKDIYGFLTLKKLKLLKKIMRAHRQQFKPSDIRRAQSLITLREIIGNRYLK